MPKNLDLYEKSSVLADWAGHEGSALIPAGPNKLPLLLQIFTDPNVQFMNLCH